MHHCTRSGTDHRYTMTRCRCCIWLLPSSNDQKTISPSDDYACMNKNSPATRSCQYRFRICTTMRIKVYQFHSAEKTVCQFHSAKKTVCQFHSAEKKTNIQKCVPHTLYDSSAILYCRSQTKLSRLTFWNVTSTCSILPRHKWPDLSNRRMIEEGTLCRRRHLQSRANFYDTPMPQFCGLKLSMLVATRSMMEDTLLGIWCIRGRFGHYTPERMRVWFVHKLAYIQVLRGPKERSSNTQKELSICAVHSTRKNGEPGRLRLFRFLECELDHSGMIERLQTKTLHSETSPPYATCCHDTSEPTFRIGVWSSRTRFAGGDTCNRAYEILTMLRCPSFAAWSSLCCSSPSDLWWRTRCGVLGIATPNLGEYDSLISSSAYQFLKRPKPTNPNASKSKVKNSIGALMVGI